MWLRRLSLAAAAVAIVAGCEVEKTQDGELPKVDIQTRDGQLPDVDIEGGRLPKYDVKRDTSSDGRDLDIRLRMDTTTIVVPKLERVPDSVSN